MDTAVAASSPVASDGLAVATARKTRGLTQRELALLAAVSLSQIRKIEQGDRPLTPGVRTALSRVLGPLSSAADGTPPAGRISVAIPLLRDIMDAYDVQPDLTAASRTLPELRRARIVIPVSGGGHARPGRCRFGDRLGDAFGAFAFLALPTP